MKLYDYYRSSACYRVRIALNLKNIPYEAIPIHLALNGGEHHKPEYVSLNPQGLVPTLLDENQILTQSLAIIEYLEETVPNPPLLPNNPVDRAKVRSLAYVIASDIHPLNNLRVLNQLRHQFKATEDQVMEWYFLWLKKGFDAYEQHLGNFTRLKSVSFGDQITLADLCLIPQVYNANRFHFPLTHYPLIQGINEYCLTLPAFQKASPEEVSN